MTKGIQYLFENSLGTLLIETFTLFYILKEISTSWIFHHHQKVLFAFENFEKANHTWVPNFLQNVYFLEDLASWVLILYVHFINAFDGHILAGEFVDAEGNFTESALSQ